MRDNNICHGTARRYRRVATTPRGPPPRAPPSRAPRTASSVGRRLRPAARSPHPLPSLRTTSADASIAPASPTNAQAATSSAAGCPAGADTPLEVVCVNQSGGAKPAAHLLKYDSILGTFDADVKVVDDATISVNGKNIAVVSDRDPLSLPWKEMGIDIVIEGTGVFLDGPGAGKHIRLAPRRLSSPPPPRATTSPPTSSA